MTENAREYKREQENARERKRMQDNGYEFPLTELYRFDKPVCRFGYGENVTHLVCLVRLEHPKARSWQYGDHEMDAWNTHLNRVAMDSRLREHYNRQCDCSLGWGWGVGRRLY